ncbi:MAG: hypothetical protein RL329_2577 [Bacteroidota bacterium]
MYFKLILISLGIKSTIIHAQNGLQKCWEKQVKSQQDSYLTFSYQEKINTLEHSFEPWEQTKAVSKGRISQNTSHFLQKDTFQYVGRNKHYYTTSELNATQLLLLEHGDTTLFPVTKSMFLNKKIETSRYSGACLIDYFHQQKIKPSKSTDKTWIVYETIINQAVVKLYIRKSDNLLDKTTILKHDDLFGDILTTVFYQDYAKLDGVFYAQHMVIEKINGKLLDDVIISNASLYKKILSLLVAPTQYQFAAEEVNKPDIKIEKYSNQIHFIELKHTDDRVLLVEFKDFLLVAEAPLSSENGDLILQAAKKIAPHKPVQYFVFGHYHPHYLGGIRAFVHEEATIICSKQDEAYVQYLTNAPHTLQPDHLQLHPKPLKIQEIKDSLTISDGSFEMKIYFIGKKSQHTNDYLVYYFPNEKLLFEDDLVWIPKVGDIPKSSGRQTGLYDAIQALHLDVKTIIQSWPVSEMGVKTVIPFADLEKSIMVKR